MKKTPPAWLIGLSLAPFGLVFGLTSTALPFLLTSVHVPVDRVAPIVALLLSPSFWGVFFAPLVDTGFTRRTHAFLLLALAAVCTTAGLGLVSAEHLSAMTALLLTGNAAMYVYGAAVLGWTADFVPDAIRGKVGGWTNAANLGAGAGGALLIMELAQHYSVHTAACFVAGALALSAVPLLFYPTPGKPKLEPRKAIVGTLKEVWATSKQRSCLIGFAMFLSPTGAFGVSNLFSGLGNDFHADPQRVIWLTGAGVAIASSMGALGGGILADRFPRGLVYISGGITAASCALAMALARHTESAFGIGVLAYSIGVGISYASFSALTLQLVGFEHAVAGTQITLFGSAGNLAIVYMTWLDGQGYHLFGLRGMFLTDGGLSLLCAGPLIWLVRRELSRRRQGVVLAAPVSS